MRALICSSLDGVESLRVGELPDPELSAGSVRVTVESTGVNFPDLLITRGLYQDKPPLPFAPGMEISGTVAEVAEDVDGLSPGDRVMGYIGHGGYAEQIVVSAHHLLPLPAGAPMDEGAAFPIVYGTSYHALVDRASLQQGESLLVLGAAGGVGLSAVQLGAAIGARVIAAVSSDEKEKAVTDAGASSVLRYDREDIRTRLKELAPDGVDVVYDPVGGATTEPAFRSLAWKGRHLVVGFAAGEIPALPVNLALLKGASLVGVFWGRFTETEPRQSRANFDRLIEWWSEGRIRPVVSDVFPLERAVEALRRIRDRGAIGKLVVRP
ncbi:MAG TPA: NADPH:quinone oxidoreductase family protein [Acidimicrobiia bacterium]|nr:NADPH:quinone oxidoreductase family protein [Acidimicrobiia bacterium]